MAGMRSLRLVVRRLEVGMDVRAWNDDFGCTG